MGEGSSGLVFDLIVSRTKIDVEVSVYNYAVRVNPFQHQ